MAAENKTRATDASVDDFIAAVPNPQRRADAEVLRAMMERLSGYPAKMWGPTMVGFGVYHYRYDSGRTGSAFRIGFAPRGQEQVLYLARDFPRFQELIGRFGRHKSSKACLYVRKLADVDEAVLEELIAESLAYMAEKYPE